MGKISDLWVKLGLKKEGFDKGIDDVKKKTKETENGFGKLKAAGIAVWAAIGAAVVSFVKDFRDKTQAVGDAWAIMASRAEARWKVMLESLTNGFDNLRQRMNDAADAAEAYTSAMDANFEIQNAFKLQRAEMARELAELEIAMRDTGKTFEERLKLIEDYKNKQGRLYLQIAEQAKYLEDVTLGKFIAGGELADTQQLRDDLKKLLTHGFGSRELLDALSNNLNRENSIAYVQDAIQSMRRQGISSSKAEADLWASVPTKIDLSKWQGEYGTDLLEMWKLYNNYRNDAETMELVDRFIATWVAESSEKENNKRVEILEQNLKAQKAQADQKAGELAEKEAKEIADATLEAEAELNAWLDEILNEPIQIELEPIEFDFSANEAGLEEIKNKYAKQLADLQFLNDQFNESLNQSIVGGIQSMTDALMGLDGADATAVLSALMTPFADMSIQLGSMLIATGTGIEAFKKSLESLQGPAAIAAGVALVALGSAMKSGIQKLAGGGGGTTASTYSGGSAGGVQTYENEMTIYVEGKISGSDIVLAGQRTVNAWKR
jgi:uncharacterized protein YecA (UPF0149 family)